MELTIIETYKEACANLRHYSQAALHIRISAIAQSVVLVTAVGYLLTENNTVFAAYAAGFGLFFTFILMALHDNYQRKCAIFIQASSNIEKQYELPCSPVMALMKDHDQRLHNFLGELFITKGLFVLMMLAFSFLLFGSFFFAK